jgi:hypothetical protein
MIEDNGNVKLKGHWLKKMAEDTGSFELKDEFVNTTLFKNIDEVKVEGITADYVWYHADLLQRDMQAWQSKFKRLVDAMEMRHKEHLKIIDDLLRDNQSLKSQLNGEQHD